MLNLRGETPVSEEPAKAPSEEPLGLAPIRAWLAKPRPRLYRLWLWVPHIAKGIREAAVWLRANTGSGLKRAAATARKAGKAAQALQRITTRLADWARTAFPPDSRGRNFAVHLTEAARQFGGAALALVGFGREFDRISPRPPRGDQPAQPEPEPERPIAEEPDDEAPSPGRILPRAPGRGPKSPPRKKPRQPIAEEPDDEEPSPGRTLLRPPANSRKSPPRKKRPASEAPRPARTDSPPAPDAPAGPRAEALGKLPKSLRVCILELGERPRKSALRFAIWRIADETGPATPKHLGLLLDVEATNLSKRHLGPLVDEGVLQRTMPDRLTHPEQAYRSTGRPPGMTPTVKSSAKTE